MTKEGSVAGPNMAPKKVAQPLPYTLQVYYDPKQDLYVAESLEIAGVQEYGKSADEALLNLRHAIEHHLKTEEEAGLKPPEPLLEASSSPSLSFSLSPEFYRRLVAISKREKTPIEKIVQEMVIGGIESRYRSHTSQPNPKARPYRRASSNKRKNKNHRYPSKKQQAEEHFLEYVRKLEKKNDSPNWSR